MNLPPLQFSEGPLRFIKNLHHYGALEASQKYSSGVLGGLRARLTDGLSSNVETVAMAGSFGRLEGSNSSDADYILIVKNTPHPAIEKDKDFIQQSIKALGALPPNKSGVFSAPRTEAELVEKLGRPEEPTDVLGKRMLLLLESRPVYDAARYEQVLRNIFTKYADLVMKDTTKDFVFLLNDLIRYFRYICVNYQAEFWRQNEKWPIRNLKLRHSRLLMYAGLLFLIGEASKYQDERKIVTIWSALSLTPLERLAWVYQENRDYSISRTVGLYNAFLAKLSDPDLRKQLTEVEYENRYELPAFSQLKANSDGFVAELSRFVYGQRGRWSDRYFEYLIF